MTVNETVLEENNPVRTVLKISGSIADVSVIQRLILYQNLKRFDLEDSVEWKGPRFIRIEQLFPVEQPSAQRVYGAPFGADSVDNIMPGSGPRARDEISKQAWGHYREIHGWVFAGTADWGVTVAADHQLASLEPGVIRANMIRGQRYTSAKIRRSEEVTSIHYPPDGRYVFRYSFSSGQGDWKAQRSYQAGLSFNNALIPVEVADDVSSKSLPPTYPFCSLQGDNLVISAVKKSEIDESIILRLYEIQGEKAETPITFLGKRQVFREINLLEQDAQGTDLEVLRFSAYQIKTLRLRPSKRGSTPP